MGRIKRGNREIIIRAKTGEEKKYLVQANLVQENDHVRAGMTLSKEPFLLPISCNSGPTKVQAYIVSLIQRLATRA